MRVIGPDSGGPPMAELTHLFSPDVLTPERRNALLHSAKILVSEAGGILGLATYEACGDDIRVHELAVEHNTRFREEDLGRPLLHALELVCLASGARRVVLLPHAMSVLSVLDCPGYRLVHHGGGLACLEKTFP